MFQVIQNKLCKKMMHYGWKQGLSGLKDKDFALKLTNDRDYCYIYIYIPAWARKEQNDLQLDFLSRNKPTESSVFNFLLSRKWYNSWSRVVYSRSRFSIVALDFCLFCISFNSYCGILFMCIYYNIYIVIYRYLPWNVT